jgi:hypothetical protein
MSDGQTQAKIAAAAVMRVLNASPEGTGVEAAAEIIELALLGATREQEKNELIRIADVQAAAHAHLSRLLNASPAVIYCRQATNNYQPTFVSESIGIFREPGPLEAACASGRCGPACRLGEGNLRRGRALDRVPL